MGNAMKPVLEFVEVSRITCHQDEIGVVFQLYMTHLPFPASPLCYKIEEKLVTNMHVNATHPASRCVRITTSSCRRAVRTLSLH